MSPFEKELRREGRALAPTGEAWSLSMVLGEGYRRLEWVLESDSAGSRRFPDRNEAIQFACLRAGA